MSSWNTRIINESMVTREIDLEEKREYMPTPMIHVPIFLLPDVTAPTTHVVVMPAPVVIPPMATMSEYMEPVLQKPVEPIVVHEEEVHQSQKNVFKQKKRKGYNEILSTVS